MKKYIYVVAVCMAVLVLAGVGVFNLVKINNQGSRLDTLQNEIAAVQNGGYITEEQAATLINAATAGKLNELQINTLISGAVSGLLNEAQVTALINASITGLLNESQVSALIAAAVSGLLDAAQVNDLIQSALGVLLGTEAVIEFEDVQWMSAGHYITVGFNFNWSEFEHVDLIVVTVYNGDDIIGKMSTTGMKLALALALGGADYESIRAAGKLTCPVGLGSDAYWNQLAWEGDVCTFTKVTVQINANHKVFEAEALNKNQTLHFYGTGVVTKPTCTEQGFTTYVCQACGEVVIDSYVDALGHKFKKLIKVVEPTCKHGKHGAQQGYTLYGCVNKHCKETQKRNFTEAYAGYKPGCAECLAEKIAEAIAEFDAFCVPYLQGYLDSNDYANLARFSGIADGFVVEVNAAATLNEVDEILARAKAKFMKLLNFLHGQPQNLADLFEYNGAARNSWNALPDGTVIIPNDNPYLDVPYGALVLINEQLAELECNVNPVNTLQDGQYFVVILGIEISGYWSHQVAFGFANVGGTLYMNVMYGGIKWADDINGTALDSHLGQISDTGNGAVVINGFGNMLISFGAAGGLVIEVDGKTLTASTPDAGIINAFWILGNTEIALSSLILA
ncbi:MAG: hypothetical protein FWE53_03525 [Firmicutes bacterium]|nr:hypothetical protein [Bacillota bacterium]